MFEQSATSEALLNFLSANPTAANLIAIAFYLWLAIWKCLALWKAAQLKQKGWFVGLFVINSLGILEIAYLFFFSKQDWKKIGQSLGIKAKTTVKTETKKSLKK